METRKEKILRRHDGSRVKIISELTQYSNKAEYKQYVLVCQKRKRTWVSPTNTDSYKYRRLSMEEREELRVREMKDVVSVTELELAAIELWESLKPNRVGEK